MRHRLVWGFSLIVLATSLGACLTDVTSPGAETPGQAEKTLTPVEIVYTGLIKDTWLEYNACGPRCWQGIILDQTTAAEAYELLTNNPIVRQVSTTDFSATEGTIRWGIRCNYFCRDIGSIRYDISSDEILCMYLFIEIPLEEIIQRYGEPSHVLIDVSRTAIAEGSYASEIYIYWQDDYFYGYAGGSDRPAIDEHLYIDGITLFSKSQTWEYVVLTSGLMATPDQLVPWTGYKTYQEYLPPP